jgi:SAM-dependent methyltransferase
MSVEPRKIMEAELPSVIADSFEHLRCPVCHGSLSLHLDELVCVGSECTAHFPIINGIPVVIDEKKTIFSFSDFHEGKATYFPVGVAWKRKLLRVIPSLTKNWRSGEMFSFLADRLLKQSESPLVLVIGGSVVGAGSEVLLENRKIRFVESDVALGPRTTIIFDAHDIPYESETFDGVVVQAVLEHVLDPQRVVAELYRVLKPEGLIYAETPFAQQVHGRQFDFTRFTFLGHRRLLRHFKELAAGASCGPGMALAWSYQYFLLSFTSNPILRQALGLFAMCTAFWLKYFDKLLITRTSALDAASAFYFIGAKAEHPLSDRELVSQYKGGF